MMSTSRAIFVRGGIALGAAGLVALWYFAAQPPAGGAGTTARAKPIVAGGDENARGPLTRPLLAQGRMSDEERAARASAAEFSQAEESLNAAWAGPPGDPAADYQVTEVRTVPEPEPELHPDLEAHMERATPMHAVPTPATIEERKELLQALEASGEGRKTWNAHFEQMEREWVQAIEKEAHVGEMSPWRCFKLGCTTTVRSPTLEAARRFEELVRNAPSSKQWRGGGYRSGPIYDASGRIETTFIFYAP
ncbi:MAG TPA: hypothetical protein VF989_17780 [Polyangiaceae bacterium]